MVLLTNFCVKQPFITWRDTEKASSPNFNMALLTTKQRNTRSIISQLGMMIRPFLCQRKLTINTSKPFFLQNLKQLINWSKKSIVSTYLMLCDRFLRASKESVTARSRELMANICYIQLLLQMYLSMNSFYSSWFFWVIFPLSAMKDWG